MKFIYRTLFLTIGLISSTACSDFLDQDSPSEMSDKVVFDNEYYTPASIFDRNLHDEYAVKKLIKSLKTLW